MLKALGACVLLGGVTGMLYSWMRQEQNRLGNLEDYIQFLMNARFRIQKEKIGIYPLLTELQLENAWLSGILSEVKENIQKRSFPRGIDIWKHSWEAHRAEGNLSKSAWKLILQSGEGLFGISYQENLRKLTLSEEQLRQLLIQEKTEYEKQRRVVLPVGVLLGIMAVITLV